MKRSARLGWHVILATALLAFMPRVFSYPLYVGAGITLSKTPYHVAVADLGNGHEDIVALNDNVAVMLGNGDGTFQSESDYDYGVNGRNYGSDIAVADLGNGHSDVIVANSDNGTISVLLGNGDGTFGTPTQYPTGSNGLYGSLAVADLNQDGKLDVVVTNYTDDTVEVLLGNGDGTLQPAIAYKVGDGPIGVAAADLGNGHVDIVVVNSLSDTVGVLLGNGDGTFGKMTPYQYVAGPSQPFATKPYAVAIGDLGNGHPDVIVTYTNNTNAVVVMVGNGDGTLGADNAYPVGNAPYAIALADLNGDGKVDVVVANSGSDTIGALYGNGDATLQTQINLYPDGESPNGLAIADINNDGFADIVVADPGSNSIGVLLGNSDGNTGSAPTYATGTAPAAVASADLGNGQIDVVVANKGNDSVSVLPGNGDGTFKAQVTYSVGGNPDAVALADLGNGNNDIVVANSGDGTVSVLLGNGDGTFQPQATYTVGNDPVSVSIKDLGNGHPDLVVSNSGDHTVGVLLGNGDGTFQTMTPYTVAANSSAATVADLGNGHPDIIVYGAGIDILIGNGDGTFQPAQDSGYTLDGGTALVVGDLGNGHPDILMTDPFANKIIIMLGNGDGTFQSPHYYAAGVDPVAIALTDVSGDGKPDVVVVNQGDDTVSVILGNGDGTIGLGQNAFIQPIAAYPLGTTPTSVTIATLTLDGWPDLIATNSGDNDISVLQHLNPQPTQCQSSGTVSGSGTIDGTLCATDAYGLSLEYSVAAISVEGVATHRRTQVINSGSFHATTSSVLTAPAHGKITEFDTTTGAFTYVADSGFSGTDRFTWQVSNGHVTATRVETLHVALPSSGKPPGGAGSGGGGTIDWLSLVLLGLSSLLRKKRV